MLQSMMMLRHDPEAVAARRVLRASYCAANATHPMHVVTSSSLLQSSQCHRWGCVLAAEVPVLHHWSPICAGWLLVRARGTECNERIVAADQPVVAVACRSRDVHCRVLHFSSCSRQLYPAAWHAYVAYSRRYVRCCYLAASSDRQQTTSHAPAYVECVLRTSGVVSCTRQLPLRLLVHASPPHDDNVRFPAAVVAATMPRVHAVLWSISMTQRAAPLPAVLFAQGRRQDAWGGTSRVSSELRLRRRYRTPSSSILRLLPGRSGAGATQATHLRTHRLQLLGPPSTRARRAFADPIDARAPARHRRHHSVGVRRSACSRPHGREPATASAQARSGAIMEGVACELCCISDS